MKIPRIVLSSVAAATIFGATSFVSAQQQPAADSTTERVTVAFSDPSRPGTLQVTLLEGSITIKGENRKDVAIEADRPDGGRFGRGRSGRGNDSAPAGLRRLNQVGGFTVDESNNTMTIGSSSVNRRLEFEVRVPTRTNLKLSTVNGGTITADDIEGELEINNVNGPIKLANIAGSVVANSVNGGVVAKLTRVTAQKAMAFTSLNGPVDVTLPSTTKANLKLRSDQGDVFTDFDIQIRPGATPTIDDTRRSSGGRFRLETNGAIYGTINGGGPEIEMRTFNGSVFVRKGS